MLLSSAVSLAVLELLLCWEPCCVESGWCVVVGAGAGAGAEGGPDREPEPAAARAGWRAGGRTQPCSRK